ncbi:MAG: branched-chain amino acid ABC transporter substrate-binding protein [Chloroflexi bacterium]|nr:branched-chain amino acid ABC transporter substrate-binding protein [Chloroflexota bacterium]
MLRTLKLPKALILFIGLVSLLFLMTACSDGDDDAPPVDVDPITRGADIPIVIPAGEPIIIGISTALTGGPVGVRGAEYRDAAVTSIERWKAANGELIGGHEIEVHAEDDGCSNSEITTRAAGHMLRGEDGHQQLPGLVGVIGPQCSGGVVAVIDDYAEAGIVMISGSATATSLTDDQPADGFFFRTAYRNDLEGTLIGLFFIGYENTYLIDDGGTYALDLADNAQRVAEEGGAMVTRRSIAPGTVDFSALVEEIVLDNADVVGFGGFNPEAALLYRQLRDAGYTGVFGAGDGAASQTGFVDPVGEDAEGVLFAGCTYPLPDDFLAEFDELHGYQPTAAFPAQYGDAATILLEAVSAVAEVRDDGALVIDPTELRDAVRATVLEDGLSGAIAFNEDGDRIPPGTANLADFLAEALANQDTSGYENLGLVPCQVQNGRLVNLLGPDAGETILP